MYGEVVVVGIIIVCKVVEVLMWFEVLEIWCVLLLFEVFVLLVVGLNSMIKDDYVKYMKCDKKVEVGSIWFVFF